MSGGIGHLVVSGPVIVAALVAALAGAVTFISPCCLPLVPGYLSYMTGMSGSAGVSAGPPGDGPASAGKGRAVAGTGLFVVGFSALFATYGAAFGGLGWTPCIGPTLSTVLALARPPGRRATARSSPSPTRSASASRSLLVAAAFQRGMTSLGFARRHARLVTRLGGVMLVALGALQVTGAVNAAGVLKHHLPNRGKDHAHGEECPRPRPGEQRERHGQADPGRGEPEQGLMPGGEQPGTPCPWPAADRTSPIRFSLSMRSRLPFPVCGGAARGADPVREPDHPAPRVGRARIGGRGAVLRDRARSPRRPPQPQVGGEQPRFPGEEPAQARRARHGGHDLLLPLADGPATERQPGLDQRAGDPQRPQHAARHAYRRLAAPYGGSCLKTYGN